MSQTTIFYKREKDQTTKPLEGLFLQHYMDKCLENETLDSPKFTMNYRFFSKDNKIHMIVASQEIDSPVVEYEFYHNVRVMTDEKGRLYYDLNKDTVAKEVVSVADYNIADIMKQDRERVSERLFDEIQYQYQAKDLARFTEAMIKLKETVNEQSVTRHGADIVYQYLSIEPSRMDLNQEVDYRYNQSVDFDLSR